MHQTARKCTFLHRFVVTNWLHVTPTDRNVTPPATKG
jgi:hypothetical protein